MGLVVFSVKLGWEEVCGGYWVEVMVVGCL